jgi:hypothetical protein
VPAQQAHAQHPPPYSRSHLQLLTFFPPRSAPCFPDRVAPPVSAPPRGRSSNRTPTSLPASLLAPQLSVPRTLGPPAVDEHQKPASVPFTQPSRPTCQRLSHRACPSPSRPNPTWQPASPAHRRSFPARWPRSPRRCTMDQLCPMARMSASAHPRPSRSSTPEPGSRRAVGEIRSAHARNHRRDHRGSPSSPTRHDHRPACL